MLRPALALTLAAALALSACGREDEDTATTTPTTTVPASARPAKGCEKVDFPPPKDPQVKRSSERIKAGEEWFVDLKTNCGPLLIELDVEGFPKTTSSFLHLVQEGFYDDLYFHRIARTPEGGPFVVQGGDPAGDGQGGPGFSVVEAPPRDQRYRRGTVAMAKTQIEEPGTSGSQFFIVTAKDSGLPPDYAVVGRVVFDRERILDRIAATPADPATEQAEAAVVIERASARMRIRD